MRPLQHGCCEFCFVSTADGLYCVGPLGKDSSELVRYFEEVPGVDPIFSTANPATWMLEATTPGNEERLGMDFAERYSNSSMFR